ncbi:MAG: hypothetical protein AAF716_04750 [Cyanobacteria bacterium P01_D01_bin.1]
MRDRFQQAAVGYGYLVFSQWSVHADELYSLIGLYEMFTGKGLPRMICHIKSGGRLVRWLRASWLFILGLVVSICIHGLATEGAIAQPVVNPVPNQATVRYEAPGGNPADDTTFRIDQPSNIVTYPLAATAGQNTLGLGLFKSADKSTAEPGDVVVYRLLIRNEGLTDADSNFRIVDTLPLGLQFVEGSVSAVLNGADFPLSVASSDGREIVLTSAAGLPANQEINVVYAAVLTPDALRGNGVNTAVVSADTFDDADDTFRLTVGSGILSDCGTILGRVFVDKNFDGQQQPGEPGLPNAVIYMDNGNRIITDPDGLFSMGNVLSGNRVGVLDLSSLTGYTLAPNLFRIEENSQSRLIRLSPGGLARMNFAVTPTFGEGET